MPKVNFSPPVHFVIFTLLGMIIGHLQIMGVSSYPKHSEILKTTYVTLFIYFMVLVVKFGLGNLNRATLSIFRRFSPLLGFLTVVIHMLILNLGFRLIILILWAIFLVKTVLLSLEEIECVFQCFCDQLLSISENIGNYFHSITSQIVNSRDDVPRVHIV